jgi:RNA-binding protein
MNSKQRSYLKSLANKLSPIVTVGKQGLTESVIKELDAVLTDKELIKASVLKNALSDPKDIMNEAAAALNAEPVLSIGSKFVLYRYSTKKDIEHIILP